MGETYFQEFASNFFMGEKYFQEFASNFFMGETYFQEFASIFSWMNNIFRNLPPISGSPELLGTLPQALFFSDKKWPPIFLQALSFWARCRRRFFFQKNGPQIFHGWAPRGPTHLGPGLGPGAGAAGRILRSQPDPFPNAPRDQIRRKDPCCDLLPHLGWINSTGGWVRSPGGVHFGQISTSSP